MEPTRIDTVKRDLLRAMADCDLAAAQRCLEEIEAADRRFWRKALSRILSPRPLTCAEVASTIVEFAALSPQEAAERMPAVQAHCEGCEDCRGALELQRRDDARLEIQLDYEELEPIVPPEYQRLPLAAGGMAGAYDSTELVQGGETPIPEPTTARGGEREQHARADLDGCLGTGGVLLFNRARKVWQWLLEPLRVPSWTLLSAETHLDFAEMSPALPPANIALRVPDLGLQVRVTVELPPALGENTTCNISFEADQMAGVRLWVGLDSGEGDEPVLYQLLPGGRRQFSEAPPQAHTYRAHFRWESAAGQGARVVDLPEFREG